MERSMESAEGQMVVDTSDTCFVRPFFHLARGDVNRLRLLSESTIDEVPKSFQLSWEQLIHDRRGNISLLDGFVFVVDILMIEEGFQKMKVPESEGETEAVRRSFYTHLSQPSTSEPYSCVLVFTRTDTRTEKGICIQSKVQERFKKSLFPDLHLPFLKITSATRYWISNAYSGSLRCNVGDMYRNLSELARFIKEGMVFKLKAIIAHGLDPPLLVGLDALPLELLESLIGACPIKDGIRLSRTCKTTLDALNNDRIWRVWARREFPALCELTDADIREKHGSWRLCLIFEWKKAAAEAAKLRMMRERSVMGYLPLEWRPFPRASPNHGHNIAPLPPYPFNNFPEDDW